MKSAFFISILAIFLAASVGAHAQTPPSSPACTVGSGPDHSGKNLTDADFHRAPPGSLRGANFNNAILDGAVFGTQDLTGATFQNASLGPSQKGNASFNQATLTSACFIGAVMNATDFNYAIFNCTDFTGASLMQADFGPAQNFPSNFVCRSKFVSAKIDVNAIDTTNWGKIDFSFADFQNVSPATFNLKGKDITGAILAGVNFSSIDMTAANLTQVDFSYAALNNAILTNVAANAATFVATNLAFATLGCARFYYQSGDTGNLNGAVCTGDPSTTVPSAAANLQSANLSYAVLTNATLDYAQLNAANLSGVNAKAATFRQANFAATNSLNAATISGANFSNASFEGAQVNSVGFLNSNLQSASFANTTMANTQFFGSVMPAANFTGAILESVSFANTVLQNANFYNTTMKIVPNGGGAGVSFSCSQLGGANFTKATVTQTSFVNAVMPGPPNCCPANAGSQLCGSVDTTGQPYGPVIYPAQTAAVTCPNGQTQTAGNMTCTVAQWQLSPNWQTSLCNSQSAMQVMWQQPPCGTPTAPVVVFSDPNLEKCILASLPGSPTQITVSTAQQQLEVICPGKGIASLGGLENFTGLQVLDLTGNQITQFAGNPFSHLQQLKIGLNQLAQLDLAGMKSLVYLDASDNQLNSLTGTADAYFEVLDLSNNKLQAVDLADQPNLLSADLSHNLLTSVTDTFTKTLDNLKSAAYLDLSYNKLQTVGALTAIAYSQKSSPSNALKTLFLACNPAFDCASMGLNGSYKPYQTSQCATFNTQSNQWTPTASGFPNCTNSN
jgi:uncharacterized protein YjbI with pentapeptide repeats